MKILIFTHIFPYPLNEGGKVAQYGIIEYLCRNNEVVLVSDNNYPGVNEDVRQLYIKLPNLKIEILKAFEPERINSFANTFLKRVNQLQWHLQKKVNRHQLNPSSILSNNVFIYPTRPRPSEIINQFITVLNKEQPDVIQVDFIDNADIVNLIPASVKSVLVHHDLRFASVEQACQLHKESIHYTNYLKNFVQTIEAAFLNKFNAIVTFSKEDQERLKPLISDSILEAIPFPLSNQLVKDFNAEAYVIKRLVFIGPHYHLPNYDAVQWYANEMSEEVYQKYNLKLVVIGNWSESARQKFSNCKGIEFAGYVENLNDVMQNSIMIVPLRIGSGIRTKLLDAFSLGVPVISTSVGCEGLGVSNKIELIIADSPKEMVECIGKMTKDLDMVNRLRYNAYELIMQKYTVERVGGLRLDLYRKLAGKSELFSTSN